jgi:hypothetical protein
MLSPSILVMNSKHLKCIHSILPVSFFISVEWWDGGREVVRGPGHVLEGYATLWRKSARIMFV